MANRRAFKSYESFLEKIAIGAVGTLRVFEDLRVQGHDPFELERGSMSFKIWRTIKIKRIRVPDIMCRRCGRRVESRAKTTLEISMSHSRSDPERGWDFGLENGDFVAFPLCRRIGDRPIDWQADTLVQYVSVAALRSAERNGQAVMTEPKGAEEGFEVRINWPADIASAPGIITRVEAERIQYRRYGDKRTVTLRLKKAGVELKPLVTEGDEVRESQIVGSVVPVVRAFPCMGKASESTYVDLLSSVLLSDRYAAAKALSELAPAGVLEPLAGRVLDHREHIYVRLEAALGLARVGHERAIEFMEQCLSDYYLENRLEAVIILAELQTDRSREILVRTLLNTEQHPEIRAGAAWALGELRDRAALNALIESFLCEDIGIRVEAARALRKLAHRFTPDIVQEFKEGGPAKRPGIVWALSKAGQFTIEQLLDALVDDDARQWVAFLAGSQGQYKFVPEIERLREKDPQVYFAATVLWKIISSWIYGLEEY